MDAKILYEIFKTTKTNNLSDLFVGLVYYKNLTHMDIQNEKEIREFIGKHYNDLVKAFTKGYDEFKETVKVCIEEDKNA
nr:MAG TPA: hypothetical protein [Caudoviricetes sp.]